MSLRGTATAIIVVSWKFYKILRSYCNAKYTTSQVIICNRRAYKRTGHKAQGTRHKGTARRARQRREDDVAKRQWFRLRRIRCKRRIERRHEARVQGAGRKVLGDLGH